MTTKETYKLNRLARYSQEEFLSQGSLLNQTKLSRFILIALLLHISVTILQFIIIGKPKDPPTPPPIKIKYVDIQKSKPIKKNKPLFSDTKLAKIKKQENAPTKQQIHRQIKIKPQIKRAKQSISKNKKTQSKLNKPPPLYPKVKKSTTKKIDEQKNFLSPPEKLSKRGTLSMLDSFDVKKYAPKEIPTLTKDNLDGDKPISLDTTEIKYVSYFNRIKQQIERSWRYPAQAARKGMAGQLTLQFQISRDGNLLGVNLVDNSGFEILDVAAVKAVKEAAPYYPFPVTISKKNISILATFVYNPKQN